MPLSKLEQLAVGDGAQIAALSAHGLGHQEKDPMLGWEGKESEGGADQARTPGYNIQDFEQIR